jgi:hypothetical protein
MNEYIIILRFVFAPQSSLKSNSRLFFFYSKCNSRLFFFTQNVIQDCNQMNNEFHLNTKNLEEFKFKF